MIMGFYDIIVAVTLLFVVTLLLAAMSHIVAEMSLVTVMLWVL